MIVRGGEYTDKRNTNTAADNLVAAADNKSVIRPSLHNTCITYIIKDMNNFIIVLVDQTKTELDTVKSKQVIIIVIQWK